MTPYVGSNNNWWIGDIDTGILARGTDGEDGYTPVKGVDYFTEEEIQQIQNEVSGGAIGDFKAVVDEETATCKEKGIELILATIPNVPSISNYYKNDFVRNSGYRYIDFAKAVGAEEIGSTWYENMLSSDKVHPALLGAKALASRFLIDVPEVIN